jgi:polyisoprenyl-phosphate glycosyltransferase
MSPTNKPPNSSGNVRKVTLIVPCHNEAAALPVLYAALQTPLADVQEKSGVRFELLFIDDGSSDGTLGVLAELLAADPRIRVVALSRNFGKEAALTAGLDAARGDAVIPFDADLQDPPDIIPALVAHWLAGAEVVLARRRNRDSDSFLKRKSAQWFYAVLHRLACIEVPANVGDFRLMDRVVVEAVRQLPERQRFMKGLFAWVGFRTVTVDYIRAPRAAGEGKFSGWRLWNFALEGITSFSTVPLRVWTYIGAAGAALTALYGTYIITRTLLHGADVPGYASLLVAVLFFGSLQLLSIGLLGEYIGRTYLETKQRPAYIVRAVLEPAADQAVNDPSLKDAEGVPAFRTAQHASR